MSYPVPVTGLVLNVADVKFFCLLFLHVKG